MKNLIESLEKNKNIKILLNDFKNDFKSTYKDEDLDGKKVMEISYETTFRKWLFSGLIQETYLTPYYIINEIAHIEEPGVYSIIPHVNLLIKNNKVSFETKWIKYSESESPVIEDLEFLLSECKPVLTIREENDLLLDNGEEIIEKLNFKTIYYLKYLIELADELDLVESMTSINCICYKVTAKFKEFEGLEGKEKVKLILKNCISLCNKKLQKLCNLKNVNIEKDLLNNDIEVDKFKKYYKEKMKLYESVSNLTKKDNKVQKLSDDLKLNTSELMAARDFGVILDENFTIVFSYYLGVIIPIYAENFYVKVFTLLLKISIDCNSYIEALFSLEDAHDLTRLGELLLKDYKIKYNKKLFDYDDEDDFKEGIDFYLENKDEDIKDDLKVLNYMMDETLLSCKSAEEESSRILSEEIQEHVEEFCEYLMSKNFNMEKAEKYFECVLCYIGYYLKLTNLKELKKISKKSMNDFLIECYIPDFAKSKTNVSEVIASINQYLNFLKYKKLINEKVIDEYKEIADNTEKYKEYFEEQFNK